MTPFEQYIKRLQEAKDRSEGFITGAVVDMQEVIYDALLHWMDNTLEYKGGELVATEDTINLLNDFSEGFGRTITRLEPYKNAVRGFIKSLPSLADEILAYQKAAGIPVQKAAIPETQTVVVNSIVDAFTGNGLNANIVQPLRDLLHQNVSAGTRLQDAKQALKEYVKSGQDTTGKVERYATQTAQQAVDSYTGAINKKLMDTFDYSHLIISGSLIKTSSPQCRFAVNQLDGIFNKKQFDAQLVPLAEKNGLISGTTFINLPLNKLHWNCRHEFTPIMLKDGDRIGTNEFFTEKQTASA